MTVSNRSEQHAATRRALLSAARALFASEGYAAVSLAAVVAAAGVTKGALYHHFPDGKASLFAAVLDEMGCEVGDAVAARAEEEAEPWDQFVAGCRAFLDATADPEVQQVMLLDGPVVLGWARWRAMDDETAARHLAEALEGLIAAGEIAEQPVEPLARLLSGAMNEAALWLARSDEPRDVEDVWAALLGLLESLRQRP